jgi:hypothetical protein
MSDPRRLNRSGGHAQELLQSAALDRGSEASRRRALELATTAGAFARQAEEHEVSRRTARLPRAAAKWVALGAAAGGILAFGASQLGSRGSTSAVSERTPSAELPTFTGPSVAASPLEIAPEPRVVAPNARAPTRSTPRAPGGFEPWVASLPSNVDAAEALGIEAARQALGRGDAALALATLNAHDQAHPHGSLAPQSLALRIQSLLVSGKAGDAKALANEFQSSYPAHPLGGQIKRATSGG